MAKVGRPTKYNKGILEKARHYVNNFELLGDVIPSHIGVALACGIRSSTLYDWAGHEDKKEFSEILEEILQKQHQILINSGLTGKFNSNIVKLVLGKHGYHDKSDNTLSSPGGGPVEVTQFTLVKSETKK